MMFNQFTNRRRAFFNPLQTPSVNELARPALTTFNAVLQTARETAESVRRMSDFKLRAQQQVTQGLQQNLSNIVLEQTKAANKQMEQAYDRGTKLMLKNADVATDMVKQMTDISQDIQKTERENVKLQNDYNETVYTQQQLNSRAGLDREQRAQFHKDDLMSKGFKLDAEGNLMTDEEGNPLLSMQGQGVMDSEDAYKLQGQAAQFFQDVSRYDPGSNTFTVTKKNGSQTQMTPSQLMGVVGRMNDDMNPSQLRQAFDGIEKRTLTGLDVEFSYDRTKDEPIDQQLEKYRDGNTYNIPSPELNRLITLSANDPEAKEFLTGGMYTIKEATQYLNSEHIEYVNLLLASSEFKLKESNTLGDLNKMLAESVSKKKSSFDIDRINKILVNLSSRGIAPGTTVKQLMEQGLVEETNKLGPSDMYQFNIDKILGQNSTVSQGSTSTPTQEYDPKTSDLFSNNTSS